MGYKQRMPKGQVPVLSLPDGTLMPEMNDICKFLALMPSPAGRQLVVDEGQDRMLHVVNGALLNRVAHIVAESDSVREEATQFLQQFAAQLGAGSFFGGAVPGYAELALWLLVEDCLLIVPDLLDPLDASFKQWYVRIADLPHLAEFFASRPQVGDGTYGMPGSILHSGAPRSAGTQGL